MSYLVICLCVVALAVGQILFKVVSTKIAAPADLLTKREPMLLLLAALSIYGVSTLGWVFALRSVPLSRAYLFMAGGFILVPIASYLIFDEPLTLRFSIGALLVAVGIVVAVS